MGESKRAKGKGKKRKGQKGTDRQTGGEGEGCVLLYAVASLTLSLLICTRALAPSPSLCSDIQQTTHTLTEKGRETKTSLPANQPLRGHQCAYVAK